MPEIIHCPECDRTVAVPERLFGKTVRCPSCKATFVARPAAEEALPPAREKRPIQRQDDDDDRDERATRRRRPRDDDEEEDDRPRRRRRDEEDDEDVEEDRPRRKRRRLTGDEVWGWKRVRFGLTLVVIAAAVGLLANIGGVIGFKAIVEDTRTASSQGVPAVAPSLSTGFIVFLVVYYLACVAAVGVAIAGNVTCMAIPGQLGARSTLTSSIAMFCLGTFLFVGGIIYLIVRLRLWGNSAAAARDSGPGAPPLEGLIVFIFGGTLLLAQPGVFSLFVRSAAQATRQNGLALSLIFQAVVAGIIALVFVIAAMSLYSSLTGLFGAMFENRNRGGVEEIGQTSSTVLKVLYFVEIGYAAWFITSLVLVQTGISRYIDRRYA